MRKTIVLAALLMVALCSMASASESWAPSVGQAQLKWRRSLAAVVGGYTDSTAIAFRLPVTTAFSETTVAVATDGVAWGLATGSTGAGAVYGWGKLVFQTSTSDAALDTFFVSTQGSVDGQKWSTVHSSGFAVFAPSAASQAVSPLTCDLDAAASANGSACGYPYMRWIIQGDNDIAAANVRLWILYVKKENN